MHELKRRRRRLPRIRFVDVDLLDHSGTRRLARHKKGSQAYHGGVEFIDASPLLLTRVHYVDLAELKRPRCLHTLDYRLCRVAEATWTPREEGDATVAQAACRTQHGGPRRKSLGFDRERYVVVLIVL